MMKKLAHAFLVLLLLFAAGCGDHKRIAITLTPSASQSVDEGQSFNLTATLKNDSKKKGVTWTLTGAGTLSGQTSTSVTYNAPSSSAASAARRRLRGNGIVNSTVTITATSVAETKIAATLQVTVNPAPSIGTPTLPDAPEGSTYSQTVSGSGGSGALTYSLASGTLPAGLSLNSSTGAIAGTPTGPTGTSTFAIKVTDASNVSALSATSGNITIKVTLPGAPTISTTSLPAGAVGVAYNQTVSASGGVAPLTYSINLGTLPAGLGINASSGAITGMPTAAGSSTFTVKVTDSSTPTAQTATKQLSIAVTSTFAITTASLPNGTVSTAYSQQLQATGGTSPLTWSMQAGSSLPAGLSISSSGLISGTPTAAGTTNFTVKAVDSSATPQTTTKAFSITIATNNAGLCDPTNTGSEALLNGQYAMVVQGFNTVGASLIGATFDADGAGHIATHVGVIDVNRNNGAPAGPFNSPIDSTQSSYSIGADHRGCMKLVSPAGTFPFRFTVSSITSGVATKAHVIEAVTLFEWGSGTLLKQDPTAFHTNQLQGNYAFGIGSQQSNFEKYAAVGQFHIDGAGNVTGQLDTNRAGELNSNGSTFPASAIPIASGTYTVAANGRGSLGFTPTGGSQQNAIIYVLNSSNFLIMSSDLQGSSTLLFQGSATLQTGTPFTNTSMDAVSVFGTSGGSINSNTATVVRVGFMQPQPPVVGALHYVYNDDGGGSTLPSVTAQVTFTVDANGRGTMLQTGTGIAVLSLSAPNQGYILFMVDPLTTQADQTVSFGQFWPQSGTPFNDPTFGGVNWSFGSAGADAGNAVHTDGWAQFASNAPAVGDTVSGNTDTVSADTSVSLNIPYAYKLFTDPNTGQLNWMDSGSANISAGYQISPKSIVAIDSLSSTAPVLLYYDAQ